MYEDDDESLEMQEKFYDPELFKDELAEIDKEIAEIDALYADVKQHYDVVKNSQSRGSLSFVEKQTTNLVNLKTAKLNWLKEKIAAKKTTTDYAYKDTQLTKKTDGASDALSEKIINKITEAFVYNNKDNLSVREDLDDIDYDTELENEIDPNDLDEIESVVGNSFVRTEESEGIDDIEEEISVSTDEIEELESDEESSEEELIEAYDESTGEFYLLNSNFEIVEELGSDYDEVSDEYYEEDDNQYIYNDEGLKLYLVIET